MYPLTRALAIALLLCGHAPAQTQEKTIESKPPDALHELEYRARIALAPQAGRAVVQVFSTGFTLSERRRVRQRQPADTAAEHRVGGHR